MKPLVLGLLLLPLSTRAAEVETLISNGPSDRRVDLVIMGDGYRATDQTKLRQDAVKLITYLFAMNPFKEYQGLFNVKLIHVVSNQEGADNGTYGASRDTALGAYFNCGGIDRLLCVDYKVVHNQANTDAPERDVIVVLVNDPKNGGSGGDVAVISTNDLAKEIFVHEVGHTLAHLADEYTGNYPEYKPCATECPEPNASLKATRGTVKWASWIDQATPIPTPEGTTGVGIFDGCRYKDHGVYRPTDHSCVMRLLGQPFCPVCAEGLILALWSRSKPIEDAVPSPLSAVNVTPCASVTFSITTPLVATLGHFVWTLDGTTQPSVTESYTLATATLADGPHRVTVTVHDGTSLVRNDPSRVLQETLTWAVVSGPCGGAPDGGSGATGGGSGATGGGGGATGGGSGATGGGSSATGGGSGSTGGASEMVVGSCGCSTPDPSSLCLCALGAWLTRRAMGRRAVLPGRHGSGPTG